MNVFLDTSAVIKLYHKEVGSDELLALLNAQAHDLILPITDITRTEFHSAFLRRVRMQEIPSTSVFAVFGLLDRDLKMFHQIVVDATVKNMATTLLEAPCLSRDNPETGRFPGGDDVTGQVT